jgi:hypothetical protein
MVCTIRNGARRSLVLMAGDVGVRTLDDRHYYRDREAQCRKAAAEATDPSARIAHLQLAEFYARRLEATEDSESKSAVSG